MNSPSLEPFSERCRGRTVLSKVEAQAKISPIAWTWHLFINELRAVLTKAEIEIPGEILV